jgi:hypothetical protein
MADMTSGDFMEGDRIQVSVQGRVLGVGAFLRILGKAIIWFDPYGNCKVSDWRFSTVKKVSDAEVSDQEDALQGRVG